MRSARGTSSGKAGRARQESRPGPARRRRSVAADPLKKVTFQLSESVVDAIRGLVDSGAAQSANVFVEDALREKLRDRRRAEVYAAYEDAARDPEYMKELNSDISAFDATLSDGS